MANKRSHFHAYAPADNVVTRIPFKLCIRREMGQINDVVRNQHIVVLYTTLPRPPSRLGREHLFAYRVIL